MASFHERQKSLFDQLANAEKEHGFSTSNKVVSSPDHNVVDRQTYRKVKGVMKQFRGQESIFKRPEAPLKHCLKKKTMPGYLKNPDKWQYYTLSDVTPDQMSDATNTATALSILKQFEEKADTDINKEDGMDSEIMFKKPLFHASAIVKDNTSDKERNIYKGHKLIMPEYVVGMAAKKNRKNKPTSTVDDSKKTKVKLGHLYEDEINE